MARTLIQEGCTLIQKGYRMLENDTRAQGVLHHDPYQGHGPYFDPTGLAVIQRAKGVLEHVPRPGHGTYVDLKGL